MAVEPVPGEPAAVADLPDERALVIADYHAGLEVGLRYEGVELRSRADERRRTVLDLLDRTDADRLVVLGDFGHAIGDPGGEEREEIEVLLDALSVPVTVVKGNHDGDLGGLLDDRDGVALTPGHGVRMGGVGFVHGHTWPSPDVLTADVVCMGHEHPMVRLEDEVGGARAERAWLRGSLDPAPFEEFHDADLAIDGELVVFPSVNDLTGGTWINVAGQEFLAPFLPAGLDGGQAYLLDGTRLGAYRRV
ncbi:putative phosphoesterase [Halorientalis persicus]|jgi:putative SbcD/Mre11-related phosphoesterase|uniref:Putative phosphoesterase n=1 Tax=Halorientalis persicus TaxID=1367881 RepID=A0A1H8JDC3_9EURY|nr:metallophosphoesterase [Halorientalis persicus]SEN78873.1 putative phosphoesterase [Halorientalis persicus]